MAIYFSRGFVLMLLVASTVPTIYAQNTDTRDRNPYGTGIGGQVLLTNSGFGLGGYYQRAVSPSVSIMAELSFGAGKDSREVAFFNQFGQRDIPNKANYLHMLTFHAGVRKRLFESSIEENFRPFFQFSFGPTLGWESPYFLDCNGDGIFNPRVDCDEDGTDTDERTFDVFSALPKGNARFGMGGNFAIGAFFGRSRAVSQGIRFGYTFTYFTDGIQLLEQQPAQRFFGTPSITIIFGKLF